MRSPTGKTSPAVLFAALVLLAAAAAAPAQPRRVRDRWVTVTEAAAGTNLAAKDRAVAAALRKAVEEACGTFLSSVSKTANYQTVYDKIIAQTGGYVLEHEVVRTWTEEGKTYVTVRAHVSTAAFEKRWARIAHTVAQESNPRCIVVIGENVQAWPRGNITQVKEAGIVQTKIEDFLLSKNIKLMDRGTTKKVSKRDILVASLKGDTKEIAALGARFDAEVFILGNCTAKFGRQIQVAGQTLYQFTAALKVRVIRADSSQLLVSKTYGPVTTNTLQRLGGEDKAMARLGEASAPRLLKAVVEAWRKQVNVQRDITLQIAGMDFELWQKFEAKAKEIRGVQALNLREITAGVAQISAEYSFKTVNLAAELSKLKLENARLKVEEVNPNRLKLKVVEK